MTPVACPAVSQYVALTLPIATDGDEVCSDLPPGFCLPVRLRPVQASATLHLSLPCSMSCSIGRKKNVAREYDFDGVCRVDDVMSMRMESARCDVCATLEIRRVGGKVDADEKLDLVLGGNAFLQTNLVEQMQASENVSYFDFSHDPGVDDDGGLLMAISRRRTWKIVEVDQQR